MGLFSNRYNREPKRIIDKDTPPKQGLALFFDVFSREFWELCKLNLIFVLFSLPIVTIPAATTAMCKVTMFMLLDKPIFVFSDFLSAFKAEWKRSTLVGIVYFPLLLGTMFGLYFYLNTMEVMLFFASLVAFIILTVSGFYLFPMLAALDIGMKGVLTNSLLLVFMRLPQNIVALLAIGFISLCILAAFPVSIIIVLVISIAISNLISTFCAYTGFKKFVIKEE